MSLRWCWWPCNTSGEAQEGLRSGLECLSRRVEAKQRFPLQSCPTRHGRAFSTVLGCVFPLLGHSSFFLGFLQKSGLCWA